MTSKTYQLDDLLHVMATMRDLQKGCAWTRAQTWESLTEYTIEESYELVDAVENHDDSAVKYELADVLNQVVFYAQIAKERHLFDFHSVVDVLTKKLINRHPDVFAEGHLQNVEALEKQWQQIKRQEQGERQSELDGIAYNLPALTIAKKLQIRASVVGFDWQKIESVLAKLEREVVELKEVLMINQEKAQEELGNLMFSCVNLARHLKVDPEALMRRANKKFEKRFRGMETELKQQNRKISSLQPEELEVLWEEQKLKESYL